MITKLQAMEARGTLVMFSYRNKLVTVRTSGQCRVWKKDITRFRLPIKYGLWEHGEITQNNCERFFLTMGAALLEHEGKHNDHPET